MSVEWDILEVPAVRYEYKTIFYELYKYYRKKRNKQMKPNQTKRNETQQT